MGLFSSGQQSLEPYYQGAYTTTGFIAPLILATVADTALSYPAYLKSRCLAAGKPQPFFLKSLLRPSTIPAMYTGVVANTCYYFPGTVAEALVVDGAGPYVGKLPASLGAGLIFSPLYAVADTTSMRLSLDASYRARWRCSPVQFYRDAQEMRGLPLTAVLGAIMTALYFGDPQNMFNAWLLQFNHPWLGETNGQPSWLAWSLAYTANVPIILSTQILSALNDRQQVSKERPTARHIWLTMLRRHGLSDTVTRLYRGAGWRTLSMSISTTVFPEVRKATERQFRVESKSLA